MMHTIHRTIFMLGILFIIPSISGCAAVRKNPQFVNIGVGISTSAATLGMTKVADAVGRAFCPEDFICKDDRRNPLPGFKRVNPDKDWHVKWTPGITHPEHAHIAAAKIKYLWIPEPGYRWASGKEPGERRDGENNLEVQWSPNSTHPYQKHIVAAETEGFWKPELGYWWSCRENDKYRDGDSNLEVREGSPPSSDIARLFRGNPCPSSKDLINDISRQFDSYRKFKGKFNLNE